MNIKFITLAQAIKLLENCSAVIVDNIVTYPEINENDIFLNWDDGTHEFSANFPENKNKLQVKICGSCMYLFDDDNCEREITLLSPMDLEVELSAIEVNSNEVKEMDEDMKSGKIGKLK